MDGLTCQIWPMSHQLMAADVNCVNKQLVFASHVLLTYVNVMVFSVKKQKNLLTVDVQNFKKMFHYTFVYKNKLNKKPRCCQNICENQDESPEPRQGEMIRGKNCICVPKKNGCRFVG